MILWLCLRFDKISLQSLSREEHIPIAIFQDRQIISMNQCATFLGVKKGSCVEEVNNLDINVKLIPRNQAAEKKCLDELCLWAYDIAPQINIWRNCLRIEIGGCLKLFGSLETLLSHIERSITKIGYDTCYGIAPNPSACWLMSHGNQKFNIAFKANLKKKFHNSH